MHLQDRSWCQQYTLVIDQVSVVTCWLPFLVLDTCVAHAEAVDGLHIAQTVYVSAFRTALGFAYYPILGSGLHGDHSGEAFVVDVRPRYGMLRSGSSPEEVGRQGLRQ